MKKALPKKRVRQKPELEADVSEAEKATACRACDLSHPMSCPFCTKEGLLLIAVAIILVAVNSTWTRYAAWVFLLAAFMVPLLKQLFRRK
ncbi:hypothetical protein JW898_02315 [Candidatus Woesearchaeota archaeon]|nr:hypothetical protein [Candidatus Woesearchaeota archaeon]